jgi:hypothetical protein
MPDGTESTGSELLVSVYLDTNVLLDLLATVEDGFALVERVTTGQTATRATEQAGSLDAGGPGAFSLFKFSGRLGRSTNKENTETTEAERTHTFGSMLHRLRRYLMDEQLLVDFDSGGSAAIEVGKFIEFRGVARPNPFTASFERLRRMLSFADVAFGMDGGSSQQAQPPARQRGQNRPVRRNQPSAEQAQLKAINDFLGQLTADVEREGTNTIVFESQSTQYTAIATLFETYLRDRSMAEILNREFRLLGKVARHLPSGSLETVDLLASSGIAGFPSDVLSQLSGAIDEMSGTGVAQVGTPSTEIEPPVVEVIPIAIFL